jgi:Spherulation-specific family 4
MMKRFTFAAAVLMLATISGMQAQTRIAVPSYQNPGTSTWQSWAAQGPAAVGIMIVDIGKGDTVSYSSRVDSAIQQTRKAGIYVLAYTYTGYATRDPKVIRQKIDAAYNNYDIDGIFFDEGATSCSAANTFAGTNYLYYQELTNYVRRKHAGAHLTVLNPGTYSASDCWMSMFNILLNWENVGLAKYQTNYIDYPWVHKYPAERFWHVILGVPQSQLQTTINLAQSRNAGWVYISDSPDNVYNQVPVYWAAEGTAIAQQGVQAPYGTWWPDSSDATEGTVSFCWRAVSGQVWDMFLDTDQNRETGYHGPQTTVGADYLLETSYLGIAKLYRYTGSGTEWSWTQITTANAKATFPDQGVNLVSFDLSAIGDVSALTYQIRSSDQNYNQLYTSYAIPLSLNNTGFVQDTLNHFQ